MLLLVLFLFINVVTLSSMIIKKISKGGTIRNNRRGGGQFPKKIYARETCLTRSGTEKKNYADK